MVLKRTSEERENITADDVIQRLKTLSSTLQLEYLENLNKRNNLLPGIRVLACRKLSELYENKGLYAFAANILRQAAASAVLYNEKKELFLRVGSLYVKAGETLFASDAFKAALEAEKPSERNVLQKQIRNIYIAEADNFGKIGKTSRAVELYERILKAPQESENAAEIKGIKLKLSDLYKRIGRIKDSLDMKREV